MNLYEYLAKEQARAHAKGLPKNFTVPTQPLGTNRPWVVICKCGESVSVGSAPWPQTKGEIKRIEEHNKKCPLLK